MPRGRKPGQINDPARRTSRTNLAAMFRDRFHENIIFDWFVMILSGKSPILVEDARCEAGYRVEQDPEDKMITPPERRDTAMRELLNRRDGLPAQRVQIEQELRMLKLEGKFGGEDIRDLAPAQLGAIVGALKGAFAPKELPPGREDDDDDTEDAEIVEVTKGTPAADVAGPENHTS